MNNSQLSIRVGLFFLLGVALIWTTFETLSGGKINKHGYSVVAAFDDLKELKVGDEVRMAGVTIGSVKQARLAGSGAEAVLEIAQGIQIPGDSTAVIAMSGLIGTNYVSIDEGTAPVALADGSTIRTRTAPDFNTIMTEIGDLGTKLNGTLTAITNAFNGNGKDRGLIQNLNELIVDNRDKVGATLANLQEISTKINRGDGTLGKLINDPDLHDRLLATVDQLKAAAGQVQTVIANAQQVVDQVKAGKGAVGELIYDQQTAENIKVAVQNLRQVSDKIARGDGTLGKLINDPSLYDTTKSTITKADRVLDSVGDSGPITAVGIVANSLF